MQKPLKKPTNPFADKPAIDAGVQLSADKVAQEQQLAERYMDRAPTPAPTRSRADGYDETLPPARCNVALRDALQAIAEVDDRSESYLIRAFVEKAVKTRLLLAEERQDPEDRELLKLVEEAQRKRIPS